ncbi:hypothetical protein G4G28_04355 [Massilia sp. Dwa41.01b]|nr:hypothetical protein G4G28_04355 [Massilia sp. Dwa41.01b]QNB01345.1 hypothetical protein G4G31_08080 [Massilia sp. Se16.2.3]
MINIVGLSLGLAVAASAGAEVVVVAGAASPVAKMTSDQVADLYLGKSSGPALIDQDKNSAARTEFLEKVASKKGAQYEATWAKIEFSGKGMRPKVHASDAAVKKALAADPNAIGYIDKDAVDGSVKVLLSVQ